MRLRAWKLILLAISFALAEAPPPVPAFARSPVEELKADWQAVHQHAVELYLGGKYEEALPLMERAADLAKALEQRHPEVAQSYLFLAHAYLKAGFIYAVPSSNPRDGVRFVTPAPMSDSVHGTLKALCFMLQAMERDMRSKDPEWTLQDLQNLEQVAEFCRAVAQKALDNMLKKRAGIGFPLRYKCEVVAPRIAIFDTRIEDYTDRARNILQKDQNIRIEKVHDILPGLASFYRATGRSDEAAALEARLERR